MTVNQLRALVAGDKVKITVLKFLPYMIGRLIFRTKDDRAHVRYFDTTGAERISLFYPDEIDLP